MPDASYERLAASSLRLLKKYGRAVTFRDFTLGGTYNTTTGTLSQSYVDEDRFAAVFPYGSGVQMIRGQLVQATDRRVLLDPTGTAPEANDHVIVGDDDYSIVSGVEINPAGTVVLYDLHVRR